MSKASTSTASTSTAAKPSKEINPQEIVNHFQKLREEQRVIAEKANELQAEQKSHEMVIETLKDVEKDRKCFRMIGGVLVERTVAEVLPALEQNREQLSKLIQSFQSQLVAKGKEINDYREKYNIRFQGEQDQDQKPKQTAEASSTNNQNKNTSGVLVAKSS